MFSCGDHFERSRFELKVILRRQEETSLITTIDRDIIN